VARPEPHEEIGFDAPEVQRRVRQQPFDFRDGFRSQRLKLGQEIRSPGVEIQLPKRLRQVAPGVFASGCRCGGASRKLGGRAGARIHRSFGCRLGRDEGENGSRGTAEVLSQGKADQNQSNGKENHDGFRVQHAEKSNYEFYAPLDSASPLLRDSSADVAAAEDRNPTGVVRIPFRLAASTGQAGSGEDRACDGLELDLVGAAADLEHLGVAHQLLER